MLSPDWNTNFIFPFLRKEDWEGRGDERGLSLLEYCDWKESRSVIRRKFRRFYFIILIIYFSWQVGKLKTCLPRNESLEFFFSSSSFFLSRVNQVTASFRSERLKKYRGSLKSREDSNIVRREEQMCFYYHFFLSVGSNRILRLDYSLHRDKTWKIFLSRKFKYFVLG